MPVLFDLIFVLMYFRSPHELRVQNFRTHLIRADFYTGDKFNDKRRGENIKFSASFISNQAESFRS